MARRVIALMYTDAPVINEEEVALDAMVPGHLIELVPTGVQKNTVDGEALCPSFALERDEVGRDIDVAYVIGDVVKAATFHAGQRVYAFLASGENVTKGEYLTGSTVAGVLAASGGATDRIARALEAVISVSDATRIRVEIV